MGDGRPFWRVIVQTATGSASQPLFEDIYGHYQQPGAWKVAPGAPQALQRLRSAGLKLAVVSNFDTRLRPLLQGLQLDHLFDALIISAEVGAEKPNRAIFHAALEALGVAADDAVHLGDDRRNDVWGARDAGILAWLWADDVHSFDEVADCVLAGQLPPMASSSSDAG